MLPEIYKIVDGEFFAPIGYRDSPSADSFFVHNQGEALKKLFERELRVFVHEKPVDLLVKFCVDEFKSGCLEPRKTLRSVILKSIRMNSRSINLSNVANHPLLTDVMIDLGNRKCFEMLCEELKSAQKDLSSATEVYLSANNISSLEPLEKLKGLRISSFDLRVNMISSFEEFHFIRFFNVLELKVIGNPVARERNFEADIKSILTNLKSIDSHNFEAQSDGSPLQQIDFDNRSDPITLNENASAIYSPSNASDLLQNPFYMCTNDSWCKVVINHQGKASKEVILSEMYRQLFNAVPFYPCYYHHNDHVDHFFLCNSFAAMEKLLESKLRMEIPSHNCVVKFHLQLDVATWQPGQINWRNKLNYVVKKRIIGSRLDLDYLVDDVDLDDMLVPIPTENGLMKILSIAKAINNNIYSISMRGNKISKVEGLHGLRNFPQLVVLDLRDNSIQSFDGFPEMPRMVELFLDKNPICTKYCEEPWRYVAQLRNIFTTLEYLDGRRLDKNSGLAIMQNFLVSPKVYAITECFLKAFFELFDSSLRTSIKHFYLKTSVFTMSCDPDMVGGFREYSRNTLGNLSRNLQSVFMGQKIIELFNSFPQTFHDFATLQVDVPLITEQSVLITINGYFKELSRYLNDDDRIFGFTRTFILIKTEERLGTIDKVFKYCICNEQLHIKKISEHAANKAFKKQVVTEREVQTICKDLLPTKAQSEMANILILKSITKLKDDWCKR